MIIKAVRMAYRDGCRQDRKKDQRAFEILCTNGEIPERVTVFGQSFYLLHDRSRLSHPDLCEKYDAVYLLDFDLMTP